VTVVVVDDERRSRERLARLLQQVPGLDVVGEAASGGAALAVIAERQPDAIFLDVQMPGITGFDVVAALPADRRPWVVFVTAYSQHAAEAFDVSAVDYVVKPVTQERLARAVTRLRAREATRIGTQTSQSPGSTPRLQIIVGKQRQTYHVLPLEAVEAFVVDRALVFAITADGRFLIDATLRALEARLEGGRFARVHKQTLVNLSHLSELAPIARGGTTARLRSGHVIDVSRRYTPTLRRILHW